LWPLGGAKEASIGEVVMALEPNPADTNDPAELILESERGVHTCSTPDSSSIILRIIHSISTFLAASASSKSLSCEPLISTTLEFGSCLQPPGC